MIYIMSLYLYVFSVYVGCIGDSACFDANFYCPETADCTLYCDPDEDAPCTAANLYLSDPDDSYNDSLLMVSCESDCGIYQYLCADIDDTATCSRSLAVDRKLWTVNCTTNGGYCEVCSGMIHGTYLI